MATSTAPLQVLNSLVGRPSRASAAAIGHHYVMNGVPPGLRIRGLSALADMVCDWTTVILEEVITDPSRGYLVQQYAFGLLENLVKRAIDQGYRRLSPLECARLVAQARAGLKRQFTAGDSGESEAVEDLCNHLAQAVADDVFGQMPDF